MPTEITFTVHGYPPAKSEAISMLGQGHAHAPRVLLLLRAAAQRAADAQFEGFGSEPIGLALTVRCPRGPLRSDATNYLGGIADVLEDKSRRGVLAHLGDLATCGLYDNDNQIEGVRYHWEDADEPSYEVGLWSLEG